MSHDVFISYSSKNAKYAKKIYEMFEGSGIKCWMDESSIGTARVFSEEISEGLKNSKILVLVCSKDAQDSEYVNTEVGTAFFDDMPIIAFKIDDWIPTDDLKFYLKNTQWLDASKTKREQTKKTLEECFDKLLADTQEVLDMVKKGTYKIPQGGSGDVPFRYVRPGFWSKYKKALIALVIVAVVVVAGFALFNGMSDDSTSQTNETGISIGYVGVEDYGNNNYGYFVFGTVSDTLSNSSDDVIHIDFYDKSGNVADTSDTKLGEIEGNILGSIEIDNKNIDKVSLKLKNSDDKVLYEVDSDNIMENK